MKIHKNEGHLPTRSL